MIIEEIVNLLDRPRLSSRGWIAKCPAHPDRNPSLNIKAGEKAILLKCWAGCSLDEICLALGVKPRDLFFDADLTYLDRGAIQRREREKEKIKKAEQANDRLIDLRREAEATINATKGVDVSTWTPEQLDKVMDVVSDAWLILIKEERNE